jgi:hypothetical protein
MKVSKKQAEASRIVRGLVDGLAKVGGYGAPPAPRKDCKVTITVEIQTEAANKKAKKKGKNK